MSEQRVPGITGFSFEGASLTKWTKHVFTHRLHQNTFRDVGDKRKVLGDKEQEVEKCVSNRGKAFLVELKICSHILQLEIKYQYAIWETAGIRKIPFVNCSLPLVPL